MLDVARGFLTRQIKPRLASNQARVTQFCQDELVKLLRYYDKTLEVLGARGRSHEDDPERKARIDAKIEAAKAERDQRIQDVLSKYRITVSARLDSVVFSVFLR